MSSSIPPAARECWSVETTALMLGIAREAVVQLVERGWIHYAVIGGQTYPGKIHAEEVRQHLRSGWQPALPVPEPVPVVPVVVTRESQADALRSARASRGRRRSAEPR